SGPADSQLVQRTACWSPPEGVLHPTIVPAPLMPSAAPAPPADRPGSVVAAPKAGHRTGLVRLAVVMTKPTLTREGWIPAALARSAPAGVGSGMNVWLWNTNACCGPFTKSPATSPWMLMALPCPKSDVHNSVEPAVQRPGWSATAVRTVTATWPLLLM